jgi:hypothetical protein
MKKHTAHLLCAAASSLFFSAQSTQAAQTLTEGLQTGSTIKVNVRTRYEDVSWDGLKDSDALTVRSRLSYQSGAWNGFAITAEMDNVTEVDHEVDYRTWAKDPKNPGTAIISDPQGTDLNQALVSYSTFNNQVKVGRQRIVLDNSRFIGNVGWRQNEQTYDGVSFTNKSIRYTNIFVAHITNVNRIFGNETPLQGDYKQDTNLINVSYTGFEAGKLTGYAYLTDNLSDPYLVAAAVSPTVGQVAANKSALSNNTYGVRWASTANPAFMYTLEYAKQESAYDNPFEYSADYKFAEVSTTLGRFVPALGYEILGSDNGGKAFQTPFATLHAFNGWADRFLTTPVNGLKDMYINLGATFSGVQLLASYHDYKSDVKSIDYGTEWNLSASKKFGAVTYLVKYAAFKNDGLAEKVVASAPTATLSDTTKIWLQADWNF